MKAKTLLLPLLLLVACQPAEETIYISSQGDRVNTGTRKDPVATYNQAVRRLEEIRQEDPTRDVRFVFLDDWYWLSDKISIRS